MVSARFAFLAVAAASIISGAFAQPHRRHAEKHAARSVTVVNVVRPVVRVYVVVDQYGNTISSNRETIYPDTAQPSTTLSTHKHRKSRKTTSTHTTSIVVVTEPAPVPAPPKSTSTPVETSSPVTGGGKLGTGIVYSPYHDSGLCKDKATVQREVKEVIDSGNGYNWLRIYGTDCGQVENVVCAAYENGVKVMLGIYNILDDSAFQGELSTLIAGVKSANKEFGKAENDWSSIVIISVGNEVVNNAGGSPDVVSKSISAAAVARSTLRAAGYTGTVANADVWIWYKSFPALCGEDPIVPINMHPFFDGNCDVASSGAFLKTHLAEIQAVCGADKQVLIVETGWPNAGNLMNKAQPGKPEQKQFLKLAAANLDTYVLLSAYDEGWKQENTAAHVEKHWGILGSSPSN